MQCGVACLQMICKYYGKNYSLDELSIYSTPTNEGISLRGLSEGATNIGLHSVCSKTTVEQLKSKVLPCILHWNQDHFVVLYKIKKTFFGEQFYIADPGKGQIIYNKDEFEKNWISTKDQNKEMGIAMFLQVTPIFYEKKEKKYNQKRSFSFLFRYFKGYKKLLGQIILGALVGSILQLIFPFLTQAIVDIGIVNKNISFIYLILLAQLMLTISRTSVDFIRRWILLHISMRINISLLSDFFIKLLKLPMSFFDTKLIGDLMQRMSDHKRIESFLTNQAIIVFFSLLSFIIFGVVLLIYNLTIFSVFIIGSIIYAIWISSFLKKRKILDYTYFEKQSINNNKTYQFLTSVQEIKLQDCEQRRRWEWEDIQADMWDVQMKTLKLQQTQDAGNILINETKNIIITVLAATAVINGEMTLGMMLAVQYIIGQLSLPVEHLMSFIYMLQDVKISIERVNEIHEKEDEENPQNSLSKLDETNLKITLEKINFKYDKHSSRNIINDTSFTIPHGKVTAIVGTSGSGKTTLIKLLLGYYHVLSGKITIGETPINNINLKWWRRQCGVVMQDGIIFSESIARNIAVDDNEIDHKRLLTAVEIANINEFIEKLPLGYNTIIGKDGIGLSQGQKQRILIARAIYKNPQFIFLDEATNALDANNERVIVKNLSEYYIGKTVVIVAHRLSTVQFADQIIVIEQGKIVEIGNHLELVKKQGSYYNLVKNQLELGR
jgi:ATP-binding cassette subfamily B protein